MPGDQYGSALLRNLRRRSGWHFAGQGHHIRGRLRRNFARRFGILLRWSLWRLLWRCRRFFGWHRLRRFTANRGRCDLLFKIFRLYRHDGYFSLSIPSQTCIKRAPSRIDRSQQIRPAMLASDRLDKHMSKQAHILGEALLRLAGMRGWWRGPFSEMTHRLRSHSSPNPRTSDERMNWTQCLSG